jgi:TolB-like protein/tetratricopeptide (TPR) repeat protein
METGQVTQTTVFVSYSRADRKRALPIIRLLEEAGHAVWWDGMLEGGERFAKTTARALDTARAVVVLWSNTSIQSDWVHDEATSGRDRRILVPLSLDGSLPPLGFRQFQVIDLQNSRMKRGDPAVDAMLRAVAALHEGAPAAAPPQALGKAQPRGLDRRLLLGGGSAVLAAGAGALWWRSQQDSKPVAAAPAAASVAVLPFANLAGGDDQAYFAEGLAAEIRAELARNPRLQVAAQASSNRYRTRAEDARTMAGALGVSFLLDGSVRRAGQMVRVSAELIDGRSGFSKWTEQFERPLADVFAVQDEIASAVATALNARIAGQAQPSTARAVGGTSNVRAYDAFLRGRDLLLLGADEASDRAALASFDKAIAIDAGYGAAHAARSRALIVVGSLYASSAERVRVYADAVDTASRAVGLAPELADAHSALGFALFNGALDARAARGPFDRSAQLGQGDADVLSRFALFCARTGRFDEARTAITRATRLDPLNARSFRQAGEVEFAARNYAAAIPPIEKALSLNPRMGVARSTIGYCRLLQKDFGAAEAAFRADPSALFGLTGLAITLYLKGDRAGARAAYDKLVAEHGEQAIYQRAQVLAQWGQSNAAMAMLQRARTERDAGLVYTRNDPMMDPLRTLPGFSDLLTSLGFS